MLGALASRPCVINVTGLQAYLHEIHKTGLLSDAEADQLQSLVGSKLKQLHYSPPRLPPASPAQQLQEHPMFAAMCQEDFKRQVLCPIMLPWRQQRLKT